MSERRDSFEILRHAKNDLPPETGKASFLERIPNLMGFYVATRIAMGAKQPNVFDDQYVGGPCIVRNLAEYSITPNTSETYDGSEFFVSPPIANVAGAELYYFPGFSELNVQGRWGNYFSDPNATYFNSFAAYPGSTALYNSLKKLDGLPVLEVFVVAPSEFRAVVVPQGTSAPWSYLPDDHFPVEATNHYKPCVLDPKNGEHPRFTIQCQGANAGNIGIWRFYGYVNGYAAGDGSNVFKPVWVLEEVNEANCSGSGSGTGTGSGGGTTTTTGTTTGTGTSTGTPTGTGTGSGTSTGTGTGTSTSTATSTSGGGGGGGGGGGSSTSTTTSTRTSTSTSTTSSTSTSTGAGTATGTAPAADCSCIVAGGESATVTGQVSVPCDGTPTLVSFSASLVLTSPSPIQFTARLAGDPTVGGTPAVGSVSGQCSDGSGKISAVGIDLFCSGGNWSYMITVAVGNGDVVFRAGNVFYPTCPMSADGNSYLTGGSPEIFNQDIPEGSPDDGSSVYFTISP